MSKSLTLSNQREPSKEQYVWWHCHLVFKVGTAVPASSSLDSPGLPGPGRWSFRGAVFGNSGATSPTTWADKLIFMFVQSVTPEPAVSAGQLVSYLAEQNRTERIMSQKLLSRSTMSCFYPTKCWCLQIYGEITPWTFFISVRANSSVLSPQGGDNDLCHDDLGMQKTGSARGHVDVLLRPHKEPYPNQFLCRRRVQPTSPVISHS